MKTKIHSMINIILYLLLLINLSFTKSIPLPTNIDKIIETLETQKETYDEKFIKGKINFAIFFIDEKSINQVKDDNQDDNQINDGDYKIFYSQDKKLAEKLKIPYPGMIAFNRDENVIYRLNYTEPSKMINIIKTPIFSKMDSANYRFYEESGLPIFYFVDNKNINKEEENKEECKYDEDKNNNDKNNNNNNNNDKYNKVNINNDVNNNKSNDAYYQIALTLRNVLKIAKIPFNDSSSLKSFNITKDDLPALISFKDKKKYRIITLTPPKMLTFLKDFLDNKIEPFVLSQDEPLSNDGPLFVLTNKNYKKYFDDTVFVFHAPYCGHCVRLKPVVEKLAEVLKGVLRVGMIDMTLNDMPEFDIRGFPTIMFRGNEYKKSDKVKGDRSLEDLVKWVKIESGIEGFNENIVNEVNEVGGVKEDL
ncbi:putative protein disulfide-isomerase C1F5.02 [Dictyocoela muelleri]|nr:putative protein disulfide-isomerase C1F5.02 [Dictyocoela muelleri]